MKNLGDGFTFLALAYNHEKYIIEHLESIKYLVEKYGSGINCKIIINDDCSNDRTIELIDRWLGQNSNLFHTVVKLYNKNNLGTCASLINMLSHVDTAHLKLTACDDIYSFENIFECMALEDNVSILSGYPLALVDGELFLNRSDIYNMIASDIIYGKKPLIDRFKFLSNNNAPNIIYNYKYLIDKRVLRFLKRFDVIEDWPIQIAIAENFPSTKYKQVGKVFVYYRRTSGSTYLVARDRFYEDKIKAYNYLIDNENNFFMKTLLKNRLACFKLNNFYLNKILNFSFYVYLFSFFSNILKILEKNESIDFNFESHRAHYRLIKRRSFLF
jgi:glycosyltransferase involved in cell wall biosynthesis